MDETLAIRLDWRVCARIVLMGSEDWVAWKVEQVHCAHRQACLHTCPTPLLFSLSFRIGAKARTPSDAQ